MKRKFDLVRHIIRLLEEDSTLTPEIREILEEVLKRLQKPETLSHNEIIEFVKILVALLSVIHHHT